MADSSSSGVLTAVDLGGSRRQGVARLLGRDWAGGFLFSLPMLIVLFGFVAYPFFSAIWLSMTNKMIGTEGVFVGLANYQKLLASTDFRQIALNSGVYTFGSVAVKLVVGMTAAVVLHEGLRPRNLWRMLLFLPWSIPVVIGAYTWRWIYDDLSGVLSQTLIQTGLVDHYIYWLANKALTMGSIIAVVVWQGTPFYIMNFLAGLAAIPQELYEAAEVDGAGAIRKFFDITLPSMVPVIIIVTLLSTIWTSNNMQIVFVLTHGGPQGVSEIYPFTSFKYAIELKQLAMGAAVPLMFFPFMAVIIYFLTRRMLQED
ncbi:MAG: sugar ABC transporter permease [Chloroflexi bacterium]|nr:sugar ABC transporter permease [Chloroflexota bacterium]MCL5109531.1 sugar ABC transporter permease [Chloroflexota bacterium]